MMRRIHETVWLWGSALVLGAASAAGAVTVNEQYTYDAVGRLVEVVRDSVSTQYVYDASGNILARTVPEPGAGVAGAVALSVLAQLRRRARRRDDSPKVALHHEGFEPADDELETPAS